MSLTTKVLQSRKLEITQIYKPGVHNGIDIVGANYTLDGVIAHSKGKVIAVRRNSTGFEPGGSYGNYVKIDHGNGYCTLYAHMASNSVIVSKGQYVEEGQKLGYMGNTGTSYGGHVHFEVWKNGERINPTEFLNESFSNNDLNKSTEELAKEVIAGKYGNGEYRKNALGNKYNEVQALVNEMLKPKVNYLKCDYNGVSIVDGLKSIGVDSSYEYRTKLANANGIYNYVGSAEQNTQMLDLLKKGKLRQA